VVNALRTAFSDVRYVSIYGRYGGALPGTSDIPVSSETNQQIVEHPYLSDVICGKAIDSDPQVKRRVAGLLATLNPDIIVLEQVYPFLGLRSLLDELGRSPTLVYDAHNVEHAMKAAMYDSLLTDASDASRLVATIRTAEEALVRSSAIVAAVSEDDAAELRAMGAQRVVVAPNGTSPMQSSHGAINRHRAFRARHMIDATLVFVSSAHEPNWRSFLDMVGTKMGFVPPRARILLCGGVSDLAQPANVSDSDIENATFWQRVIAMGHLQEGELVAILSSAGAILLPVASGGGSNLKTAEALASGRQVVATTFAFRGYEAFADIEGVTIADTPDLFRRAMLEAIRKPAPMRSQHDDERIQQLYWPARLSPLVEGMANIAGEAHLG
jgi:glycosyltransferase involved in cell wall biosynthesis